MYNNIIEKFDIEGYCKSLGIYDVEIIVNMAGNILLYVNDVYPENPSVYEVGNIGLNAWCVKKRS